MKFFAIIECINKHRVVPPKNYDATEMVRSHRRETTNSIRFKTTAPSFFHSVSRDRHCERNQPNAHIPPVEYANEWMYIFILFLSSNQRCTLVPIALTEKFPYENTPLAKSFHRHNVKCETELSGTNTRRKKISA